MKKSIVFFSLMIFLFSFIFIGNVNAMTFDGVEYPDIPDEYKNENFIVLKDKYNDTWLLILTDEITSNVNNDSSQLKYNGNSGTIKLYKMSSGNWGFANTLFTIHDTGFTYIASTVDIYNGNTIFFQKTPLAPEGLLAETMKMIAEETPQAGTTVITQMRTILLCGVGCLAFLISLPLLLKVFSRYRH